MTDDRELEERSRRQLDKIARLKAAGIPTDRLEWYIRQGMPPGDHPDPLTEEDEEILDRAWATPLDRQGELKKDE